MSRNLVAGLLAEVTAAELSPVMLAFFDFQSGGTRMWTGVGTISWNGNSYLGLGNFASISPVEESTDVRANGVSFQVSGVPSAMIALALADNYQGRDVKLWLGALNSSGALVADPYQIFSGRMDSVEIDEGPDTAVVRINAESRLIDLNRSKERRYTHEDQQINFPGDLGLEYMPTAQSTSFLWGGQKVPTYAETGIGDFTTIDPAG